MTQAAPSFRFSPRPNRAAEIAWRPWGEEAFDEARAADKPVLLAISAVWCHWCHVMDETSYSDPEVIRSINERYVPVRVDNDERPDVNRRYNLGGWPTTAFLTPDGEILHGGTYVPPDQMRATLGSVADLWRDKKAELTERVAAARREPDREAEQSDAELSGEIVDTVGALVRGQYDPRYGGFGREPKFPQPKLVRFVLDEHRRHGYPELATMLHKTLGAMASGGMHDHVEGGFFRYATTRHWEVPHYEKMLEDNAELLALYAEAHRTFPTAGYDRIVRDVVRWMDAVLWSSDLQAFAGSQDADEHYYTLDSQERAKHKPPFVDRAIYTSWNALAATAYFAAHAALGDDAIDDRAHAAMRTLATRMWDRERNRLWHFDRGDGPRLEDLLGDLAAYLAATLDAYETGRHPGAFDGAVRLATTLVERLEDRDRGGFFDAPARDESGRLATREKPIEENAVAADALLRLTALTHDERWRTAALHALRSFVGDYRRWGQFAAAYANAVARALAEPLVIVVAGPGADALWSVAVACDDPARSLHRLLPERDEERARTLGYPLDAPAAYVCVGTVCSAPLLDAEGLRAELGRARERYRRED